LKTIDLPYSGKRSKRAELRPCGSGRCATALTPGNADGLGYRISRERSVGLRRVTSIPPPRWVTRCRSWIRSGQRGDQDDGFKPRRDKHRLAEDPGGRKRWLMTGPPGEPELEVEAAAQRVLDEVKTPRLEEPEVTGRPRRETAQPRRRATLRSELNHRPRPSRGDDRSARRPGSGCQSWRRPAC